MRIFLPLFTASLLSAAFFANAGCELDYRMDGAGSRTSQAYDAADAGADRDAGAVLADAGASAACGSNVDRWKELLVIDPSVLTSVEASNDLAGGALSFRSRMEELAGSEALAEPFTEAWLDSWRTTASVGAIAAPVNPRPLVKDVLLDPWRAAGGGVATMALAPFRLIAVVNRLDLSANADGCSIDVGEIRFVYTATDPATRSALAMTVIVEVPYPTRAAGRGREALDGKAWARKWHALGALPFGDGYVAALAGLVHEVTAGMDPMRVRVRTNEAALGGPSGAWDLRQFSLTPSDGGRALTPSLLDTTPRDALNHSPALSSWMRSHESRLRGGVADSLSLDMQAGEATLLDPFFMWGLDVPVSETARKTFSQNTCNGCHGGERPADALFFQHLAPWDAPTNAYYGTNSATGNTLVSVYLNDPSGRDDELTRRAVSLSALLCSADCAPPAVVPSDAGAQPYDAAPSTGPAPDAGAGSGSYGTPSCR